LNQGLTSSIKETNLKKLTKLQKIRREASHLLGILFGSIFFAMGYSWFLLPHNIAPGGVGGISQILAQFTGLPNGVLMIIINIPLFVVAIMLVGKQFGAKSIYGMLVSATMTDLMSIPMLHRMGVIFHDLAKHTFVVNGRTIYAMFGPEDMLLSAVAGSVLLGIGLGIIFRFRGSTGGTDIPVALIKQKSGLSIGNAYYIVETGIIILVAAFFKDPKILIWGSMNLFLASRVTDLASEGMPYVKGVFIISQHSDEIKEEIYQKLDRGITYFKGMGGYAKKEVDILFCVMSRGQVPVLTDLVKDIDRNAFMIVTDVYDVLGYGFKSRKLDLRDE